MAGRRQSSTRHAVAGNPQFPGGGVDRISGLANDMLGHILSFLPALEAIRSSGLSRRWRRAWTHVPDLKISDDLLQDRFFDFADAVLAQYGTPDIPFPSLNVAIGCKSNLGPAAAVWLRNAMERVVGSICVHLDAMDQLVLPSSLQAKTMTLDLSADIFKKSLLIFPEPVEPAAFGRLAELSLSKLDLQIDGFGEFLSSCFPQLRKLQLRDVHPHVTDGEGQWPLILHMDMLEEFDVRIYDLNLLQVVAPKLRLLTVSYSFESLSAVFDGNTLVKISAPRLEVISWSGRFPRQLIFLTDTRCVRRLSGLHVYWPSISRIEYHLPDVVQFIETCSGADQLDLHLNIPHRYLSMSAIEDFMGHIPCLPNIRTLSLKIITILRWLCCSICPSVFSFLMRCPNLTLLHVDLSTLHQFSDLHPHDLVFPDDEDDDVENEAAKPSQGHECDLQPKDQLQLGSLQKIRISGFVGTDPEMELAELLFGVGAARPALERISISSFAQLSGRMNRIALKMKARFPLTRGRWETSPWGEIIWTKK